MARYAFLILLSPCLLPVLGVALLAAASLWRSLSRDAARREGRIRRAVREPPPAEE